MKIKKISEIEAHRAFRIFKAIGETFLTKNDPGKSIFCVGVTHKKIHEIMSLSTSFPVEVIWAKNVRPALRFLMKILPIPTPNKFIIRINDPTCLSELVEELSLFLLIGVFIFDTKLTSDFIVTAQSSYSPDCSPLEQLLESDKSSLIYIVDFDNDESETGILECWIYDSSLYNELYSKLGLYM